MHIVKKTQTNKLTPSRSTTILEYLMEETAISGALAKVNGSYPQWEFAINEISKEIAYIVRGSGKIVTNQGDQEFSQGDAIFIDQGEKFRWEGNFTMFMVTAPKFSADQHKII